MDEIDDCNFNYRVDNEILPTQFFFTHTMNGTYFLRLIFRNMRVFFEIFAHFYPEENILHT